MHKNHFKDNLKKSTLSAIEFGVKFINNKISNNITYDVALNCSYDENLIDYEIYREDDKKLIKDIDLDKVVEVLYRNGKVPAWINISICKSNKRNTRLMLECAGRYTDDLSNLYYVSSGTHPFGVKSPQMLPWIKEGDKYYLLDTNSKFEKALSNLRRKYYKLFI